MILKNLLYTRMTWMLFIKILKNKIQIKTQNIDLFDYMITDMLNNKKLNPIVTELFITGKKNLIFL